MIKTLTPIFFLLFSLCLFGQAINYEKGINSDYNQQTGGVAIFEEYSYFAENINHSYSWMSSSYLSKVDTLGNEVWRVGALLNHNKEVIKIKSIIATEQGGVLISGGGMTCCDCGVFFNFTEEFNANGVSLWSEIHEKNSVASYYSTCIYKSDSSIVFSAFYGAQGTKVYFRSPNSNLDSLELNSAPILGVSQVNNSAFFTRTIDSLFKYDFQGNILTTKAFSNSIKGLEKLANDSLVVITSDSLFILDSNLQNLFSTSFNGYNLYNNLKIIDSIVYLTAGTPQIRWLIKLDNNFQTDLIMALPYGGDFNNVELDYSLTHFSLATNFNLTNYHSIRVIDYSLNRSTGSFTNELDVGILDVRVVEASTQENSFSASVYNVNLNVDVLLHNNSSSLIEECRINSFLGNNICNERYFTEKKTGLSIAPYDSAWVSLGWIGEGEFSLFQDEISYNKCFYTSNPNGVVDLNVNNDSYCMTGIAGYVSLEEKEGVLIDVYPNPAKDFITIESKNKIDEITIYDLGGRVVKKLLNQNIVSVSELEKGVYNVEIRTEVTRTVKKIIVN